MTVTVTSIKLVLGLRKEKEVKNPRIEDVEPGLTQVRSVNSTTKQGARQNIDYEI